MISPHLWFFNKLKYFSVAFVQRKLEKLISKSKVLAKSEIRTQKSCNGSHIQWTKIKWCSIGLSWKAMQKVAIACLQHFGKCFGEKANKQKVSGTCPTTALSTQKHKLHPTPFSKVGLVNNCWRAFFPARPGRKPAHIITEEGRKISGFQEWL